MQISSIDWERTLLVRDTDQCWHVMVSYAELHRWIQSQVLVVRALSPGGSVVVPEGWREGGATIFHCQLSQCGVDGVTLGRHDPVYV